MTLTSPERVVFPKGKITKQEVADYYLSVAPKILPHLKGRVLSLVRCPGGVGDCHYFRQDPRVSNAKELMEHVQQNTIEFHINTPDIMVFDLDPGEGLGLGKVRQGARDLKSILDELGLKSTIKTSGGKGYHIMVAGGDYEFSQKVAQLMEAKWPNRYTINIRKDARGGKIFVDYLRNSPNSTSVAPYSLRAKDKATVSMPISWEQLGAVKPDLVTIKNIGKWLQS